MRLLWFPSAEFTITSELSHAETHERLLAAVEPRRNFSWDGASRPFAGRINLSDFQIWRAAGYENSFLLVIHGRIEPQGFGSRVQGTMKLHPLTLGFVVVWCTLALAIGATVAITADEEDRGAAVLISLGMLIFAWVLTSTAFSVEAARAERLLRQLVSKRSSASAAEPHN